ncbi:MAG: lamin tail domain-containing protein [Cyclobacteriaceae bacterium]|nr:lamin tail domain-containing protein [Cyclobacteriaceae bacterium]
MSEVLIAQVSENFSDGDFTANPTWTGDDSKFAIDNNRLRLQAPAVASTAYLGTSSVAINDALWEFKVEMGFNPSSSNFARVYIASDDADLSGPLNGYFVVIGDTPREVSLYKQSGTTKTKIIDGMDNTVNISMVNAKVKVTRDNLGNWELFVDVGSTGTYSSQGTASDNTFRQSAFFGFFCEYTQTRSDDFYFDDISVSGDPYVDTDPPMATQALATSANLLSITFNEPLKASTVNNPEHYVVNLGIGTPTTAALQEDEQTVHLTFSNSFANGITHSVAISGIEDMAGNSIANQSLEFLYFNPLPASFKDIVISEIMADQSPLVGLPDAEFIELYNRSSKPFDIEGWVFTDGSSKAVFEKRLLLPNEYIVVTANANVTKFGMTTNIVGVSNFPTLNNSSDTLVIKTAAGQRIDSVNYDLSWYHDLDKQEGGWSLEIIDPDNLCEGQKNWTASESERGGTPGTINSIDASNLDLTGPKLLSAIPIDSRTLLLNFDERLEIPFSPGITFLFQPEVQIESFAIADKSLRSIRVAIKDEFATRQLYNLSVNNVFDCSGNEIDESNKLEFALPENSVSGDVIINEVLFNPRPNGVDFIEVYNRSDKFINLKNWIAGNIEEDEIVNNKPLFLNDYVLKPASYLLFTSDPINIKSNYPQGREENFIVASLPSLPDNEGSIAIVNEQGTIVDSFGYSDDFHNDLVKDPEGISLERISFDASTQDDSNWTSASSVSGFATPGFQNSSFRIPGQTEIGDIQVDPEIFSPNSGFSEFTQIHFNLDNTGYTSNVKIFDQQGRLIRTIANNQILGTTGSFRWEGEQEDGTRARAGYYLVWFEIFDSSGTVKTFRKRVIIASR